MFPLQYPNIGLSEIPEFNNVLKNNSEIENILKIHTSINKEHTYHVLKYDKSKLTSELIPTFGLFRSVILNSKQEVLCVSPSKSISYETFVEKYPKKDENIVVEEFIEGTMINVFWDKSIVPNGDWVISTRSNVGANNYFYKSPNAKTFNTMFFEALNEIDFKLEQLNPLYCYSFVLQHPENRIVLKFDKPKLYLVGMYFFDNTKTHDVKLYSINMIDVRKIGLFSKISFPEIYKCNNYSDLKYNIDDKTFSYEMSYNIVGFVLYNSKTNERTKIRNPSYEYVRNLRGNQPKLQYHYLCLRQQNKVSEFLKYYSEYREEFFEFQKKIHDFTNSLYKKYISCYIKKEKPLIEFEEEYKCLRCLALQYLEVIPSHIPKE
jgi:hypothetical protein